MTNDSQSGIYFVKACGIDRECVLASDPSFAFAFWIVRHSKGKGFYGYGCLYRGKDNSLIVLHDDRRIPVQCSRSDSIFATARNILVTTDPD